MEDKSVGGSLTVNPATFSSILTQQRNKTGMSQAMLAKKTELDHSYISRIESGTRMPTREVVERLSEALHLEKSERSRFILAAGFSLPGMTPITHQILVDIEALLDHPNQSEYAKKIALDQLNTIGWWLKLGAGIEHKVQAEEFVVESSNGHH